MKTAKLFQNGRSQAVRLPKEFRFEGDEVEIYRRGNAVVLLPRKKKASALLDVLGKFSNDFMEDGRQQPPLQERDFSCFD